MREHILWGTACSLFAATLMATAQQAAAPPELTIDWSRTAFESKTTPTLQVVVNPMLLRGAPMHDGSFAALKLLGADYVRYVPWLPYPKQAVAELEPPTRDKTSWNFKYIDPTLEDFMNATAGHSVVMNFSTMPAWLWKTDKPVTYPDDPNQSYWSYTQGTELRDPTMKEAADYYARLLSWYEKGGLTDENGKWHESGHHYKFAYWELLNEIDFEHRWTPEAYTKFYDAVTAAMLKVDPDIKFMAVASAKPSAHGAMYEYFLNPKNHAPGARLDFLTYHFYASPPESEPFEAMQYTFFDQADGFLNTVRYVEQIKHRLSPTTKTDLNELGVILPEDNKSNSIPGYKAKPEPKEYWNLAAAMYAYIYIEAAKLGVDVTGESQLVGYPTQYPSVSMMNYNTSEPNARFWVLKLLKDNFGPGDRLVNTAERNHEIEIQAFVTPHGKKILAINKRSTPHTVHLPANAKAESVTYVAPSTGDKQPAKKQLTTGSIELEPFEVAVIAIQ
ncbi:MAG: glycosyl hydrolase family 39 [Edaphobacter sp.]|uniref:glycosyl hydrolase family 39 n=1 Tax=Edaphobacter sp. TaxID=1934404 RepID=UPI002384656A|nr:glycosyl hydrolase family 39 [Edaphobacter sp.]MDE1177471.1 glycosyl hydrolase family 39 [Edaphobacter sp.]